MSLPLLKLTFRKNWLLALIFLGVLTMYSTVMISMYHPEDMESLLKMFEILPPQVMSALGFAGAFHDMTGYLASWLYGLLMVAFPMVYSIILGNRLVAKTVESGSIACLLATPDSRRKIIVTKAVYAALSLVAIMAALFAINSLVGKALYPDDLDAVAFLRLNITVTLVNLVVMGITFCASCLCNDSKRSLAFGAGIPIAFLLLNMLGGAGQQLRVLKNFSIYGWYDPLKLVAGESALVINLVYLALALLCFAVGILVFQKKRLPV